MFILLGNNVLVRFYFKGILGNGSLWVKFVLTFRFIIKDLLEYNYICLFRSFLGLILYFSSIVRLFWLIFFLFKI